MVEISGWRNLFLEVSALSESAERQYGIAHLSYSKYILERLALCIDTCSNIQEIIVVSTLASDLQECSRNLTELIETLQRLHNRWENISLLWKVLLSIILYRLPSSLDEGDHSFKLASHKWNI